MIKWILYTHNPHKKNRWNEFLHWNACKEVSREGTTRMRWRWWRRIRNISEHSNIVVGQVDAVDVGLGEHGLGYHHVGDCSWLWRVHSCQWGKITIPIITLNIKSIIVILYNNHIICLLDEPSVIYQHRESSSCILTYIPSSPSSCYPCSTCQ